MLQIFKRVLKIALLNLSTMGEFCPHPQSLSLKDRNFKLDDDLHNKAAMS
jgi:hypothetical protein